MSTNNYSSQENISFKALQKMNKNMSLELSRYKQIYGEEFEIPERENVWTVRVNILKNNLYDFKQIAKQKGWDLENVPWVENAFWIKTNDILSKTIEHSLGYFFSQNASSLVPPLVLDPKPGEIILDLSAAPGAKTTQTAAMMKNSGVIIANDITPERLKALRGNLQRCGVINTIVTKTFGEIYFKKGLKFSKILLDAPCTGTGTMNPRILQETSESGINMLSNLQKRLIESAAKMLEKDGVLIYSTCSLEPEENEEVVNFAVEKFGLSVEKTKIMKLNFIPGLTEWKKRFDDFLSDAVRILPTEKTEGFFVCKLRY